MQIDGWREELDESFVQGQHDGSGRPLLRTGKSESGLRDTLARDLEARGEGSTVRARQRILQIQGCWNYLDADYREWTSDGKVGSVGRGGCARRARAARLLDCGSEGEKRWPFPFRRWRRDMVEGYRGPADRNVLVHGLHFSRLEQSCRAVCAPAVFL